MRRLFFALLAANVLCSPAARAAGQSAQTSLDCGAGPLSRTYGGAQWLVYGCSDEKSAVFVAAEGNPALPFYFMSFPKNGQRQLTGEGNGKKSATEAAFKEVSKLSDQDVLRLVAAARAMPKAAPSR